MPMSPNEHRGKDTDELFLYGSFRYFNNNEKDKRNMPYPTAEGKYLKGPIDDYKESPRYIKDKDRFKQMATER